MPTSNDAKDQLKSLQKVLKLGYEIAKKERSDQDQVLSQQLLKAQWKLSQERDTLMLTHQSLDLDLEREVMLGNEGSQIDQQYEQPQQQQHQHQQQQYYQNQDPQPTPRLNLLMKQPGYGQGTSAGLVVGVRSTSGFGSGVGSNVVSELGVPESFGQDPPVPSARPSHTAANTTTTAAITATVATAVGRRSHRVNIGTRADRQCHHHHHHHHHHQLPHPNLTLSHRPRNPYSYSPSSTSSCITTSSFMPTGGTSKPPSTATATGQGLGSEPLSPFRRARPRPHEDHNNNNSNNNNNTVMRTSSSSGSGGSLGGVRGRSAPSPVYLDDLQPVSMGEPLLSFTAVMMIGDFSSIIATTPTNPSLITETPKS